MHVLKFNYIDNLIVISLPSGTYSSSSESESRDSLSAIFYKYTEHKREKSGELCSVRIYRGGTASILCVDVVLKSFSSL